MLTITQVERETGLSKDVLRVWERRYGFPAPVRSESGDRLYDSGEVERLKLIKRLIDQGFRPGRLLSMGADELSELVRPQVAKKVPRWSDGEMAPILQAILDDNSLELRKALSQRLARQGLQRFVQDTVPDLNETVGNLWVSGELGVYQEHLYSEEVSRLLRTAIGNLPPSQSRPRILLTTLSGEEHGLGLLIVEGALAPEACSCLSLGIQTPLEDIVAAVSAHEIDILVLSFSVAFPMRQALADLKSLRPRLPQKVEIWAGGGMTRAASRQDIPGVYWTPDLEDCFARLADWRLRHSTV